MRKFIAAVLSVVLLTVPSIALSQPHPQVALSSREKRGQEFFGEALITGATTADVIQFIASNDQAYLIEANVVIRQRTIGANGGKATTYRCISSATRIANTVTVDNETCTESTTGAALTVGSPPQWVVVNDDFDHTLALRVTGVAAVTVGVKAFATVYAGTAQINVATTTTTSTSTSTTSST